MVIAESAAIRPIEIACEFAPSLDGDLVDWIVTSSCFISPLLYSQSSSLSLSMEITSHLRNRCCNLHHLRFRIVLVPNGLWQLCEPVEYLLLEVSRKAVEVVWGLQLESLFVAKHVVYACRSLHLPAHVIDPRVPITGGGDDERGLRCEEGHQFVIVEWHAVLVAYEEAEHWNQSVQMRVVPYALGALIGCAQPQGIDAANSYYTGDCVVERGAYQANLCAERVTKQIDPSGIHHAEGTDRIDSSARIGHHLAHQRPVRVPLIELPCIQHAGAEADLIECEDDEAAAHQRGQSRPPLQRVVRAGGRPRRTRRPAVLVCVRVQPDDHRKLAGLRRSVGRKRIE